MLPSQPPELEQTVLSANDLLLFMSKCPGGSSPCPNSLWCPRPRLQHTLPSWYYSDPEGTSGGEVPGPVARQVTTQIPDPRSAGLA